MLGVPPARPGPPAKPRIQITAAFRVAIFVAQTAGLPLGVIAARAGFPNPASFSFVIHGHAPVSPRTMHRLRRVADVVGYEGPLVIDELLET